MRLIKNIAYVLVVIGALNMGLWGCFQIDLLANILGGSCGMAARILFALIGLAGLYWIWYSFDHHHHNKRPGQQGHHHHKK